MAPHASPLVTFGIAVLGALVAALFVFANDRAGRALGEPERVRARRTTLASMGMITWAAVLYTLAQAGVLGRFDARPPPLVIVIAVAAILALAFGFSRAGRRVAQGLPLAALIGFQAFRLPLELVMHQAAREGVMPVEMSFAGYNFDIVTGVTAAALGGWLASGRTVPRWIAHAWNGLGLALLVTVVSIAFAASPMIRAFGSDPRHVATWVAYAPFVWLPGIMVPCALLGHVLVWRHLQSSMNDRGVEHR